MKQRCPSVSFWGKFILVLLLALVTACQPAYPAIPSKTISPTPPTERPTATPIPSPPITPSPTAVLSATPAPVVRFAVIGDYGDAGPGLAGVADLINSWEVDLILTTGDNNYPVGSPKTIDENIGQYFHSYIFPYRGEYGPGAADNRFFPTLGNHDWLWNNAQPYLDYFQLPGNERYYQFNREFIDFFALSSDWAEPDGIGENSLQAAWLRDGLENSTARWQVVFFHHSPYSSGYHGSTDHMRWPFAEWGADLVLSGHDHHYERLEISGISFFVVGLSGGAIYEIPDVYPGSQFRYNQKYGALLVEASPDQIWCGFYTIDAELVDQAACP